MIFRMTKCCEKICSEHSLHGNKKVSSSDVLSSLRNREFVEARMVLIDYLYTYCGLGVSAIGIVLNKDHSTIIYSLDNVDVVYQTNLHLKSAIRDFTIHCQRERVMSSLRKIINFTMRQEDHKSSKSNVLIKHVFLKTKVQSIINLSIQAGLVYYMKNIEKMKAVEIQEYLSIDPVQLIHAEQRIHQQTRKVLKNYIITNLNYNND